MAPIAVTLLTGFLGAGKTTLLRHILNEQHGFKIAVIENECDEVSVDDQLIGDRATQIKTLTNGCICCTRSNELEDALLDLLDSRDRGEIEFDRLVIECTGMAEPGPIIQTFFSHQVLCERYLLDGVIALVDAVHADQQMDQFTIAQSQVGYADRILLTKTDVAGDTQKLRERLARINARAPIYTVIHGDIDLSQLFNTSGFMLEEKVVSATPRFHFVSLRWASDLDGVIDNLLRLFPLILSWAAFWLLYSIVPTTQVRNRDAVIGALVAALLFEAGKKAFALYITTFPSYQLIYGVISVVPILFVWVYWTWCIVLLGAEITVTLGEYRKLKTEETEQP